jgi:hypothetical protein
MAKTMLERFVFGEPRIVSGPNPKRFLVTSKNISSISVTTESDIQYFDVRSNSPAVRRDYFRFTEDGISNQRKTFISGRKFCQFERSRLDSSTFDNFRVPLK